MPLKTFNHLALVAIILWTQACTSTPPPSPSTLLNVSEAQQLQNSILKIRSTDYQPGSDTATIQERDRVLDRYFDEAYAYCQKVIKGHEDTSFALNLTTVIIAVTGAVAGSVLAPLLIAAAPQANRAAIAALSGVSGVTNTTQMALKQAGLTSQQELQNRQSAANSMVAAFQKYSEAAKEPDPIKRYDAMIIAIQNLRVACLTYNITSIAPTKTPIAEPITPSTSTTAGGTLPNRTYYVKVTYATSNGETLPSPEKSQAVQANHVLKVTSPPKVDGVTGYNVYVSNTTGTETKQNLAVVPIGTDWQEPDTGLITGAAPPTINTATIPP